MKGLSGRCRGGAPGAGMDEFIARSDIEQSADALPRSPHLANRAGELVSALFTLHACIQSGVLFDKASLDVRTLVSSKLRFQNSAIALYVFLMRKTWIGIIAW